MLVFENPGTLGYKHKQLTFVADAGVFKVPVEDIAIVVFDSYGLVTAVDLVTALLEQGVGIVHCDQRHLPIGLTMSTVFHSLHTEILALQTQMSVPMKKRLWQQIVGNKILNQFKCLQHFKIQRPRLRELAGQVQSGDSTHCEGVASSIFFTALFGDEFLRDPDLPGVNSALNYGYAIVRACVARAIVVTGLHPALGVFHHNRYNPFCLADDLMEPLRPIVDAHVMQLLQSKQIEDELTPAVKRELVKVSVTKIKLNGKSFTLLNGIELYVSAVKAVICGEKRKVPHISW